MHNTNNLALKASADRSMTYYGTGKRSSGLRPHQMIRKMITDDLEVRRSDFE
jgi:hypothetical protein